MPQNRYAIRSLEETAQIMYQRGLLPSPSKQNALNLERRAFAKIKAACRELAEFIEGDCGGESRQDVLRSWFAERGA